MFQHYRILIFGILFDLPKIYHRNNDNIKQFFLKKNNSSNYHFKIPIKRQPKSFQLYYTLQHCMIKPLRRSLSTLLLYLRYYHQATKQFPKKCNQVPDKHRKFHQKGFKHLYNRSFWPVLAFLTIQKYFEENQSLALPINA